MDQPLTLRGYLWSLFICVFVTLALAGYVWTVSMSKLDNLDTKMKKLHNDIENIGVCQKAKVEAFTNQSRIGDLENQLGDLVEVLQACKERLQ